METDDEQRPLAADGFWAAWRGDEAPEDGGDQDEPADPWVIALLAALAVALLALGILGLLALYGPLL